MEMPLLVGNKGFRTMDILDIDLASIHGMPENEFHRPESLDRIPLFDTITSCSGKALRSVPI